MPCICPFSLAERAVFSISPIDFTKESSAFSSNKRNAIFEAGRPLMKENRKSEVF